MRAPCRRRLQLRLLHWKYIRTAEDAGRTRIRECSLDSIVRTSFTDIVRGMESIRGSDWGNCAACQRTGHLGAANRATGRGDNATSGFRVADGSTCQPQQHEDTDQAE